LTRLPRTLSRPAAHSLPSVIRKRFGVMRERHPVSTSFTID